MRAPERDAIFDFYERLLMARRDGVLLGHADGTILRANDAACRMLGRTEAEICAVRRGGIIAMEPAALRAVLDRRARDGAASGELLVRRPDGSVFPVECDSSVTRTAAGEEITVTTFRDVSDRRRIEAELQASEERLRLFVEHAPAAIAMLDRDMRYLAASRRWMTDYRLSEDVVGRRHYDVFPDIPERWKEIHRRCLAGAVERRAEDPFPRLDGRTDWVDWEIHPWRTRAGAIGGIVLFTEVVTDRKNVRDALFEAQKMESIGRLAGGVAHDFNNLLTVILCCAAELREGLSEADANLQEGAREIAEAGERARDLTRQLLAFARRQVIASVPLDVNHVVADSERLLRRIIGEDVELEVAAAPALWLTRCDPGQLEQVVLNLAVNARDAMPGGGRLVVETSNYTAGPADRDLFPGIAPGEYVRLSVRDSGHGIPADVKPRIFEPFFTTKDVGRGTGLGLATVYGIVKQVGGHIGLETEVGRGTVFHVCFPRALETATAEPATAPARVLDGSETVLLVEDNSAVREITRRTLQDAGYRVVVARGGPEALTRHAQSGGTVRLLVTDVVMPEMGGPELAARLREADPALRVLFMSGHAVTVAGMPAVLDPACAFLPKPFTPTALLEHVRAVLDGSADRTKHASRRR